MQSELSKTIDVADVKAQYDAQCKRVLSQREILARIQRRLRKNSEGWCRRRSRRYGERIRKSYQ